MPLPIPNKPRMSLDELKAAIAPHGLDVDNEKVVVVGVRGYFEDTMGVKDQNDRGIYDDAIFVVTPTLFAAYNANVDPTAVRRGSGAGAGKGMARLKSGLWRVHRLDKHKGQYLALCQRAGKVTVTRDGTPDYDDTGLFGINIHKGGFNTTSSEGCQTIPPSQWDSFISNVVGELKRYYPGKHSTTTVPYLLIDNPQ